MEQRTENDILLVIQNTLGRIEANISSLKEDVQELKDKDSAQTKALESAYAKAKNRQDSIRDDLQHQINSLDKRIDIIETKKEKSLVKWYDKLVDKLLWAIIISIAILALKWIGAPIDVIQNFGG